MAAIHLPSPSRESIDLSAVFMLWWGPLLISSLSTCRSFVPWATPDIGLVQLAAVQLAINRLATDTTIQAELDDGDILGTLLRVSPRQYCFTVQQFAEKTGIPHQSLRRHLVALVEAGYLSENRDSRFVGYRLNAFPGNIDALGQPAFSLSRWLLTACGSPPGSFHEPGNAAAWASLIGSYLDVFLALTKARRAQAGPHTHVAVQIATIYEVHINVLRELERSGPPMALTHALHGELIRRTLSRPIYLGSIADNTAISDTQARYVISRMAKVDYYVEWIDADRFRVRLDASKIEAETLGTQRNRRFFTVEMEQCLLNLVHYLMSSGAPASPMPDASDG